MTRTESNRNYYQPFTSSFFNNYLNNGGYYSDEEPLKWPSESQDEGAALMAVLHVKYPRTLRPLRWTRPERAALAKAIRSQNKRILMDRLIEQ